jgi:hypothetical protein
MQSAPFDNGVRYRNGSPLEECARIDRKIGDRAPRPTSVLLRVWKEQPTYVCDTSMTGVVPATRTRNRSASGLMFEMTVKLVIFLPTRRIRN